MNFEFNLNIAINQICNYKNVELALSSVLGNVEF